MSNLDRSDLREGSRSMKLVKKLEPFSTFDRKVRIRKERKRRVWRWEVKIVVVCFRIWAVVLWSMGGDGGGGGGWG